MFGRAGRSPGPRSQRLSGKSQFKEVGNGVLDFPAILRAAARSGVKHDFVEQDYCPGDPVDSLRQSYRYLRSVEL